MKNKNTDRLIVVHNPASTGARRVEREVFDVLDAHQLPYETFETPSPDTEENIQAMQDYLPAEGATIVSSGGDGTYAQLFNALVRGKKNLTLGSLPMGNFNDATRLKKHQSVLDLITAETEHITPLTVDIDGEYWRHVPAYLTLGWTAVAAAQFGSASSREGMKRAPQELKLLKSLGQVAQSYLQNGRTMLPAFRIGASPEYQRHTSDVIVANNPRIARIVRMPRDYGQSPDSFGINTDITVSRIAPSIDFGLRAVFGHTPHERVNELRLTFEKASQLSIQAEGEFSSVQASEIYVYKNSHDGIDVLS